MPRIRRGTKAPFFAQVRIPALGPRLPNRNTRIGWRVCGDFFLEQKNKDSPTTIGPTVSQKETRVKSKLPIPWIIIMNYKRANFPLSHFFSSFWHPPVFSPAERISTHSRENSLLLKLISDVYFLFALVAFLKKGRKQPTAIKCHYSLEKKT